MRDCPKCGDATANSYCRACQRAYNRAYYRRHRVQALARAKQRREADLGRARADEAKIRARRAEKHRADAHARERRMGRLDAESRAFDSILRHDPCAYCGEAASQVDHIDPVAHGGENHWTNLTAACAPCNRAKWDQPLLAFLGGAK